MKETDPVKVKDDDGFILLFTSFRCKYCAHDRYISFKFWMF